MAITTAIAIATTPDERWKMSVEICRFTPSLEDGSRRICFWRLTETWELLKSLTEPQTSGCKSSREDKTVRLWTADAARPWAQTHEEGRNTDCLIRAAKGKRGRSVNRHVQSELKEVRRTYFLWTTNSFWIYIPASCRWGTIRISSTEYKYTLQADSVFSNKAVWFMISWLLCWWRTQTPSGRRKQRRNTDMKRKHPSDKRASILDSDNVATVCAEGVYSEDWSVLVVGLRFGGEVKCLASMLASGYKNNSIWVFLILSLLSAAWQFHSAQEIYLYDDRVQCLVQIQSLFIKRFISRLINVFNIYLLTSAWLVWSKQGGSTPQHLHHQLQNNTVYFFTICTIEQVSSWIYLPGVLLGPSSLLSPAIQDGPHSPIL